MSLRLLPLPVAVAILLLAPAATANAVFARPLAALAFENEAGALLTWMPGPEPADVYHVYGLRDGALVLIPEATTTGTHAQVPSGFDAYGVTAVREGVESAPAFAVKAPASCVYVDLDPPSVTIGCQGP